MLQLKGRMTHRTARRGPARQPDPGLTTRFPRCPSGWKASKSSWITFTSSRPPRRSEVGKAFPMRRNCGSRTPVWWSWIMELNMDKQGAVPSRSGDCQTRKALGAGRGANAPSRPPAWKRSETTGTGGKII